MTKNIRVAYADLKRGDKVHLKGSNNVYEFIRKYDVDDESVDAFVVGAPGIFHVAISRIMFDYATRPAPKKPKLREPRTDYERKREMIGERTVQVDYDDLRDGDIIHLKDSPNHYAFKGYAYPPACERFVVEVPGAGMSVSISKSRFDSGWRVLAEPKRPENGGEYWAKTREGDWLKFLAVPPYGTLSGEYLASLDDGGSYWHCADFSKFVKRFGIIDVLTAEEYYTRRIKGEL